MMTCYHGIENNQKIEINLLIIREHFELQLKNI